MNHKSPIVRWLVLPAGGVIAAGALVVSGGLSSAQTPDPTATQTPSPEARQQDEAPSYDEILAEELGVSVDELREAEVTARERFIDQLVDEGDLSEEQATRLKDYSDSELLGAVFDVMTSEALQDLRDSVPSQIASIFDMDREALEEDLSEDKSLDEIAEEQDVTEEDIGSALESRLNDLVGMAEDAGYIDADDANDLRDAISKVIDKLVGHNAGQTDDVAPPTSETPTP